MSGVCRVSCAFHAAGNIPPDVRRSDTGQYVYTVQVRWFSASNAAVRITLMLRLSSELGMMGLGFGLVLRLGLRSE